MAAPAIGLRKRWTPKPSSRVDASHPLAAGLFGCWAPTPAGAFDLGVGGSLPVLGAPTPGTTAFGTGIRNTSGNDGAARVIGASDRLSLNVPLTLMWVGSADGTPVSNGSLFGCSYTDTDSSPFIAYAITFDGSGQPRATANNGSFLAGTGVALLPLGAHVLFMTATSSELAYWQDGVQVATSVVSISSISYGSGATFGFNQHAASRATNTTSNLGAVWNRQLTAGEIATLSGDPFQFLRS